jgi:gliding motility-associated-like protein
VQVFSGTNYTVSGQSITPAKEFSGTLAIPVTVNDGEFTSPTYTIQLTVLAVNDRPVITGQQPVSTAAGVPVAIQLAHLIVQDPDNTYPSDFTVKVLTGENYTLTGNEVKPALTFSGVLNVGVRVNDGNADSESFNLKINVSAASAKPVITNQKPVIINEDESFTITTDHLKVSDINNKYPHGFKISILPGENYEAEDLTITPIADLFGNIFVPVQVTDGKETSDPFNFLITIRPVNDAPVLVLADSTPVHAEPGFEPLKLLSSISVSDVDNDSLSLAEISFLPGQYVQGVDILSYPNAESRIKGVFDSKNGILALIGKGSIAEYAAALQSIEYLLSTEHTSGRTNTGIEVIVSDGQANSNRVQKPIRFSDTVAGALDIPTGFTPNGDAVNDTWNIRPLENPQSFEDATIRVYTKSGILVFETNGLSREWDGIHNGTMLPPDVYFYTIDFNLPGREANLKGIVTILR